MTVHIRIERLVLPNYTPSQQQRFTEALQSALDDWHARHGSGAPTRFGSAGSGLRAGVEPEEAARQVAAEVISRLSAAARTGKGHV